VATQGDLNTIATRFARGGPNNNERKKYMHAILTLVARPRRMSPLITFFDDDLADVAPTMMIW